MPKFDFTNEQIPAGVEIPTEPIVLVKNMKIEDVRVYIYQKLKEIYESDAAYLYKEMAKEDLYDELAKNSYNLETILPN